MRVYLIRHGETDWNAENRVQGIYDVPLNERGLRQARELARRLDGKKLCRVFSSNLSRSYMTALEMAKPHGIKVERDDRLAEVSQGIWEGMPVEEAREVYGTEYAKFESDPTSVTPPGGESIAKAFERVKEFWEEREVGRSAGDVAIVGHAAINAVIACLLDEIRAGHRSVAELRFDERMSRRFPEIWKSLPRNAEILEFDLTIKASG